MPSRFACCVIESFIRSSYPFRGHEIRVAFPTRYHMPVHVVGDTGTGHTPEVHADVKTVRSERATENSYAVSQLAVNLCRNLSRQRSQVSGMLTR